MSPSDTLSHDSIVAELGSEVYRTQSTRQGVPGLPFRHLKPYLIVQLLICTIVKIYGAEGPKSILKWARPYEPDQT